MIDALQLLQVAKSTTREEVTLNSAHGLSHYQAMLKQLVEDSTYQKKTLNFHSNLLEWFLSLSNVWT